MAVSVQYQFSGAVLADGVESWPRSMAAISPAGVMHVLFDYLGTGTAADVEGEPYF